jgi:hypothetical protein
MTNLFLKSNGHGGNMSETRTSEELYIVKLNYKDHHGEWVLGYKEKVAVPVIPGVNVDSNHGNAAALARKAFPGCVIVSVEKLMDEVTEKPQFPVHYTGRDIKVFTNSSGEVFVENTKTGVHMRINATREGLRFTTNNFTITQPIIVNNMIVWSLEGK